MKLLFGLGNPGDRYVETRHNVGIALVDQFARQADLIFARRPDLHSLLARESDLLIAKPTTFMNNAGQAASALVQWYKLVPAELVVVHDDLDVPLGEVRRKFGGGTAGHNGVASVAYHLTSSDFWRIRIGIGPHDPMRVAQRTTDTAGFVLAPFQTDERAVAEAVMTMVCSQLDSWLLDPKEAIDRVKGLNGEKT